ncbi:hypothetical protein BJ684DRAFT_15511 [Piptocephalis cylindrospora]|uniref:Rho-GAP domain-containing protein n=1 Tax=Piptocephalis cylindrospora TaxID=1907219 RepID=A0A4P9Y576_9FUNG|nr:hypothetical protein BJ684DRAFT_15511 [Piptocephalis cylindrospora]|eukprot:RKP14146.1 hypothetical protein BJ684DRAFT_15511 [Piptocephalis cylindrospora]
MHIPPTFSAVLLLSLPLLLTPATDAAPLFAALGAVGILGATAGGIGGGISWIKHRDRYIKEENLLGEPVDKGNPAVTRLVDPNSNLGAREDEAPQEEPKRHRHRSSHKDPHLAPQAPGSFNPSFPQVQASPGQYVMMQPPSSQQIPSQPIPGQAQSSPGPGKSREQDNGDDKDDMKSGDDKAKEVSSSTISPSSTSSESSASTPAIVAVLSLPQYPMPQTPAPSRRAESQVLCMTNKPGAFFHLIDQDLAGSFRMYGRDQVFELGGENDAHIGEITLQPLKTSTTRVVIVALSCDMTYLPLYLQPLPILDISLQLPIHPNMPVDELPRALLRHALLRLLHLTLPEHPNLRGLEGDVGSNGTKETPQFRLSSTSADLLTDVLARYLRLLAEQSMTVAAASGRSTPMALDVAWSLQQVGMGTEQLRSLALSGRAEDPGPLGIVGNRALEASLDSNLIKRSFSMRNTAVYEYREIGEIDIDALYHYQCGSFDSKFSLDEPFKGQDEPLIPPLIPRHLPPFPEMTNPIDRTIQKPGAEGFGEPGMMEGARMDKNHILPITSSSPSRLPTLSKETLKSASASGLSFSTTLPSPSEATEKMMKDNDVSPAKELRRSTLQALPKWLSRLPPPRGHPKTMMTRSTIPPSQPLEKQEEGEEGQEGQRKRKKKHRPIKVAPRNAPETTETLFASAPLADDMTSDRVGSERNGSVGAVPLGVVRRVVRERGQDAARASLPIALTEAHRTRVPLRLASSPMPTTPSTPQQATRVRLKLSTESKDKDNDY